MSAEDGGGAGRREVAYRLFAAEYDDAELEYSDSEEERAPNYVVTPTGARVNRLFVVGVLTEVESVSDDVLRARVVDPTGAFVIYAGQYQPDAQAFLERAEPPMFVAVTGKARTYQPEDSDRIFTSVRPESVNEVDAGTRDRWTVQAAAHTLERVRTMAAALERPERGEELRGALRADGVDDGLAEGIPLAIDHYDTSTAYLAAVRDAALQAAAVVAGEREEVDPLGLAPDEGGDVPLEIDADLSGVAPGTAPESGEPAEEAPADESAAEPAEEPADERTAESTEASVDGSATEATAEAGSGGTTPAEPATASESEDSAAAAESGAGAGGESVPDDAGADGLGDFDDFGADDDVETDESTETVETTEPTETAETDELYELDEDERREVEEEFGTEFSTGTEVDDPGEADIETPDPDAAGGEAPDAEAVESAAPEDAEAVATDAEDASEPTEADAPGETLEDATADGTDDAVDEAVPADAPGPSGDEPDDDAAAGTGDVDLTDAVMDAMRDLDDGNGADRDAVIDAVVDAHGVDPADVEDAIEDALMSGRCYEPDDATLKAI